MSFRIGVGIGCTGGLRPQNEDNFLVAQGGRARTRKGEGELVAEQATHGLLVAVADGMGGHQDGAVAAETAVRAMSRLAAEEPVPEDPEAALLAFVLDSHAALRKQFAPTGDVDLGTTLTVGWVLGRALHWVHVGDSRCYLYRAGYLLKLSRDHTVGEFAERDGRAVSPAQAASLCQAFLFGSRGLGHRASLRLDRGLDSGTVPLQPGDRLLFCTDGLSGFLAEEVLRDRVSATEKAGAMAVGLIDAALRAGSDDNVTALVVHVA